MALETLGSAHPARPRGFAGGRAGGRRRAGGAAEWPRPGPTARLLGRRPRPVDPAGPASVRVSRATVIDARPLADEAAASDWLERIDPPAAASGALAVVNRLVGAHRIAAADPFVHQLPAHAAVVVRAGYGEGQEVADGGWRRAVELVASGGERGPQRRRAVLRPDERLAALLSARELPLACQELALRARFDLDFDRPVAAALGTRLALEAVLVELGADARTSGLEERLAELRELHDDVIAAANATLVGPAASAQSQIVAHALGRIEATLRARAARG